ncbi:hypothetical protein BDY21DRAFT_66540 [Lineolata rhizophorae]|uniref:Uncharacterized protein n=1 Tax=Lineolata rhizophorae TaxID=578093 RepID=A0A6A6NVL4_9PEZI|nr:hypothetical protein BDY21DRAFT_66540 [Lineolata rhizophorae]
MYWLLLRTVPVKKIELASLELISTGSCLRGPDSTLVEVSLRTRRFRSALGMIQRRSILSRKLSIQIGLCKQTEHTLLCRVALSCDAAGRDAPFRLVHRVIAWQTTLLAQCNLETEKRRKDSTDAIIKDEILFLSAVRWPDLELASAAARLPGDCAREDRRVRKVAQVIGEKRPRGALTGSRRCRAITSWRT